MAICVWVAFAAGYGVRTLRESSDVKLPLTRLTPTEYYTSRKSFSEVDQAKDLLQALSCETLTELRLNYNPSVLRMAGRGLDGPAAAKNRVRQGIEKIEAAMQEFEGTEQELVLIQELLFVLKHDQQYDRWLDLYLQTLYHRPTERVVARCLRDALDISRLAGRETEVHAALEHLARIPLEFPAKAAAALVLQTQPPNGRRS